MKMHRWPSDGTLHPVRKKHKKYKKINKTANSGFKKANNKYVEGK